MFKELQADLDGSVLLLGLSLNDAERLRGGETLSFALTEVNLGGGSFTVAFGRGTSPVAVPGANEQARLVLTEGMIDWMLTSTPMSSRFDEVGLRGQGRVVVFHGKTDAEMAASVIDYKRRLARSFEPDRSVVTAYRLDRASGKVTVERFERAQSDTAAAPANVAAAPPSVAPVLASAVGTVAAVFGAIEQRDSLARVTLAVIAVVLAGATVWSVRRMARDRP